MVSNVIIEIVLPVHDTWWGFWAIFGSRWESGLADVHSTPMASDDTSFIPQAQSCSVPHDKTSSRSLKSFCLTTHIEGLHEKMISLFFSHTQKWQLNNGSRWFLQPFLFFTFTLEANVNGFCFSASVFICFIVLHFYPLGFPFSLSNFASVMIINFSKTRRLPDRIIYCGFRVIWLIFLRIKSRVYAEKVCYVFVFQYSRPQRLL